MNRRVLFFYLTTYFRPLPPLPLSSTFFIRLLACLPASIIIRSSSPLPFFCLPTLLALLLVSFLAIKMHFPSFSSFKTKNSCCCCYWCPCFVLSFRSQFFVPNSFHLCRLFTGTLAHSFHCVYFLLNDVKQMLSSNKNKAFLMLCYVIVHAMQLNFILTKVVHHVTSNLRLATKASK